MKQSRCEMKVASKVSGQEVVSPRRRYGVIHSLQWVWGGSPGRQVGSIGGLLIRFREHSNGTPDSDDQTFSRTRTSTVLG